MSVAPNFILVIFLEDSISSLLLCVDTFPWSLDKRFLERVVMYLLLEPNHWSLNPVRDIADIRVAWVTEALSHSGLLYLSILAGSRYQESITISSFKAFTSRNRLVT